MAKTKCILFILALFVVLTGFGQNKSKYNRYFAKDKLSFSFNSAQLLGANKIGGISELSNGLNLQFMQAIVGVKSNVALAAGFGWANQNYYLNNFVNTNSDSIWFTQIADSLNHKKYKLNTNYLIIPIELRFRSNPDAESKSYKLYVGFRAGLMINSHTKYVGNDRFTDKRIKEKQYNIKHLEPIDYGVTLRFGKGDFMLNGYYSLSNLFLKEKGYELTPVEIGLTIVLF